jgi:hypothetical protein
MLKLGVCAREIHFVSCQHVYSKHLWSDGCTKKWLAVVQKGHAIKMRVQQILKIVKEVVG